MSARVRFFLRAPAVIDQYAFRFTSSPYSYPMSTMGSGFLARLDAFEAGAMPRRFKRVHADDASAQHAISPM